MNITTNESFTVFLHTKSRFPQLILWGFLVITLFLIIAKSIFGIEMNQDSLIFILVILGMVSAFSWLGYKLFSNPFKTLVIFSNHLVLIDYELNEHYLDWDKVLSVEIDQPPEKTNQIRFTLLLDKKEIDKPFFKGKIEFTVNEVFELSPEKNTDRIIEFLKKMSQPK